MQQLLYIKNKIKSLYKNFTHVYNSQKYCNKDINCGEQCIVDQGSLIILYCIEKGQTLLIYYIIIIFMTIVTI